MNLSVFASLATFPRKLVDAARNAIIFVRTTLGDQLSGSEQHMAAVKMLASGFDKVPKWAIHAVIGATFGWIEKHTPERLTPAIGAIGDAVETLANQALDSVKVSPFDAAQAMLQPPAVQPIRPLAPVGAGESSPQNAAQPQLPLASRGLSPSDRVG